MKIFNATPHEINIVEGAEFNSAVRKFQGGTVIRSIQRNGLLNAKISTVEVESVDSIPTFDKRIDGCDPLPEGYDAYIVSALYGAAWRRQNPDGIGVYTVADPLYDASDINRIIGCRGICPVM